ncbi:MAG TPA: hypothetical protein VGF28_00635 [Thermoanaerobaculia bacterium]
MWRRLIMAVSAAFMAILGVAATFAPDELLPRLGAPATPALTLAIQLLGALYLAFAILNWTARQSLIGGIYNRPVALGNMLHFTAGALALIKGAAGTELVALAALYALFAVAFGWVLFTSPVTPVTKK